jgi:hypothetical protein
MMPLPASRMGVFTLLKATAKLRFKHILYSSKILVNTVQVCNELPGKGYGGRYVNFFTDSVSGPFCVPRVKILGQNSKK